VDAEVSDYAGRHAMGATQVRQWLQSGILAEFREHVVGTLEIFGERVTWVDTLADADGVTRPVRIAATVQNGKIRTFVSNDLGPRLPVPGGLQPQDLAVPLLLGLLVPVVGWLSLRLSLSLTLRGTDALALGEDRSPHPSLVALRDLTEKRRHERMTVATSALHGLVGGAREGSARAADVLTNRRLPPAAGS
jgi:hypothetical protein